MNDVRLKGGLEIPAAEIAVEYARSGGPGGQHVNKTETKVTLRFDVRASSLPDEVKDKLTRRLSTRLTKNGELLISCDTHRERQRNLEIAQERLKEMLDKALVTELEAAAFRRLVEHLRTRTDVQNIDLMNLAGFCRNCLSNWYQEAAAARGLQLTKEGAREVIYGMPYKEWQAKHQTEASPESKAAFEQVKPHQH